MIKAFKETDFEVSHDEHGLIGWECITGQRKTFPKMRFSMLGKEYNVSRSPI